MICSIFKPSRRKNGKSTKSRLYWGQYRLDGDTKICRVPLKTTDKQVARRRLDDIVRKIQQERAGLIEPSSALEAASKSVVQLGDLYTANLEVLGRDDHYVKITGDRIRRLSNECNWKTLRDITAASFQEWRAKQTTSAKTVNDYLATMRGFIRWLMRQEMAKFDPLVNVEKVETRGRRIRHRRAFTVDEVRRLLSAAPVDRRQFYLMGYYTGLRRSELQSLQWGDIHLDDEAPYILVRASTTKNRDTARLAIRSELCDMLRSMRPQDFAADKPVFGNVMDVAGGHKLRRFKRDLKAAGIEYKDAQGRIADFHALSRVTPNTHLGERGVGERIRQEFMRHSDLKLTSMIYTDAQQLPTAQAIQALPSFSLEKCAQIRAQKPDFRGHKESQHVAHNWVI